MAHIVAINGPRAGMRFDVTGNLVTIGRHPDCEIYLAEETRVSRHHAQIVRAGDEFLLRDCGSRNGTMLNDRRLEDQEQRLQDGDHISICGVLFIFYAGMALDSAAACRSTATEDFTTVSRSDAGYDTCESSIAELVVNRLEPAGAEPKFSTYGPTGRSLLEECRQLRAVLEHNHVHFPGAAEVGLADALRQSDPRVLVILGRGFHRVVVFDAQTGVDTQGEFSLTRFLRIAIEQMAAAFGFHAGTQAYHPEEISQVLKDEPRSLFCFLNIQLMSVDDLHRLRGFTQERHQTLLCGPHDFETLPILQTSAHTRLAALLEITRDLGNTIAGDDVFPKTLNHLFRVFPQADRGVIVLQTPEGTLIPRWAKTRQPADEGPLRISRTLVRHVLDSMEAVLSADASRDERWDRSQDMAEVRLRSLMCAPLLGAQGQALGVIQIDTLDTRKRFQQEDLEFLAGVAVQLGRAIDCERLYDVQLQRAELQRELTMAAEVQLVLLPRQRPQVEGYEFDDFYRVAYHVSGDYYDYILRPDGSWAIVVADVAGKGLPAGMLMAHLAAETRSCMGTELPPAAAVARLNERLCRLASDRFVTLVLAVLDTIRHEVTTVNAGHIPPLWRRADGSLQEVGAEQIGVPLGVFEGYAYEPTVLSVGSGETFLLYTDGIPEAMNQRGEQYGSGRLRQLLMGADHGRVGSQTVVEALATDVRRFLGEAAPTDDMCLVSLSRR
jgi:serine phosphatase RsbU (regulator of sigma subunit)